MNIPNFLDRITDQVSYENNFKMRILSINNYFSYKASSACCNLKSLSKSITINRISLSIRSAYSSIYLTIYLSIYLSIYLHLYVQIHVYILIYIQIYIDICRYIIIFSYTIGLIQAFTNRKKSKFKNKNQQVQNSAHSRPFF